MQQAIIRIVTECIVGVRGSRTPAGLTLGMVGLRNNAFSEALGTESVAATALNITGSYRFFGEEV